MYAKIGTRSPSRPISAGAGAAKTSGQAPVLILRAKVGLGISPARAFSIIELLVAVAVLAVLLALLLPVLASVRAEGRRSVCQNNLRQHAQLLLAYTADARDFFPSWLGDGAAIQNDRSQWGRYTAQHHLVPWDQRWREYTGWDRFSPIWHCPRSQVDWNAEGAGWDIDYVWTGALYADPSYLDPEAPRERTADRLGGRVQTLASVAFPDRKVGAFENRVWHEWPLTLVDGIDIGPLYYDYPTNPRAGSVAFLDGHAEPLHRRDAIPYVDRYPIWPSRTFVTTPWGVRGRDR